MPRRRPRATVVTLTDPEHYTGIEQSELFIALVTPHWLRDRQAQNEWHYARALGKPMRALLLQGATLPETFTVGIADFDSVVVHTTADMAAAVVRWLGEEVTP